MAALTEAKASIPDAPAKTRPTYVVQSGDTLYGIANARLAASGAASDPGAAMRYALQIAQSNGIRDPNRIYVGQTLDIWRSPTHTSARNEFPGSVPASGNVATASAAAPASRPNWETRVVDDEPRDATDELEFDLPEIVAAHSPAEAQVVGDATPVNDPTDASARLAIARYHEAATLTAPAAASQIQPPSAVAQPSETMPDIFYKGLVGKALDALPMDTSARTGLQQANAVIGSSFAGRSLAALTGVGGPILTLAGLVWGLFSAQKIAASQPAETAPAQATRPDLTAARE